MAKQRKTRKRDDIQIMTRRRAAAAFPPPQGVVVVPVLPRGRVAARIVALLREVAPDAMPPAEIAARIRSPRSTVTKELARLAKIRKDGRPAPVQRTARGLYRSWLSPADLDRIEDPPPRIHALQLAAKLPPFGGYPPRSRAPAREATGSSDPATGSAGAAPRQKGLPRADASWALVRDESQWVIDPESRSRRRVLHPAIGPRVLRATLQVYGTTGTVLVSVESSSDPLAPHEVAVLTSWLQGVWASEGWPWTEPQVVGLEINRDYRRVRLSGREEIRMYLGRLGIRGESRLTLRALHGVLLRIYNKDEVGAMRMEARVHPVGLELGELQGLVETVFYGARFPGPVASGASDEDRRDMDTGGMYA